MQSENEARQLQRQLTLAWIVIAAIAVTFAWPVVRSWIGFGIGDSGTPREVTPRGELANFEKTTIDLFENVSPSVVYLTTRSLVSGPFLSRAVEVEAGSGSGFIWDDQGHIVTNFHVLQGSTSAQVVLWDQTTHEARTVGGAPNHDLAVLKIQAPLSKLKPVPIGESENLRVGQSVFAIGNPFGLNQTLTTGIVSAKSRVIESPGGRPIEDVIQIDAAINPGNSGGPLLDSAGRLIGVNTAIYSRSGTSAGVGFAIPVDTVNRVVPQIIANGRYEPPRLGVTVHRQLSEAVTSRLDVPGVLIQAVTPGSGADAAGLRGTEIDESGVRRLGDIIQKINDEDVNNMNQMLVALEHHSPGDTVIVEYWRDGEERTASVVLK